MSLRGYDMLKLSPASMIEIAAYIRHSEELKNLGRKENYQLKWTLSSKLYIY